MWRRGLFHSLCVFLSCCAALAQNPVHKGRNATLKSSTGSWTFAVSGDSRNCGDIVMPAIAQSALHDKAVFYWHLGDFRAMSHPDEDLLQLNPGITLPDYRAKAWDDFIQSQLSPFGKTPVFLGLGNHEMVANTRADALSKFGKWFDAPAIHSQRIADDPADTATKTYFHWIERGVDFITLDNATDEQFDAAQMQWLDQVLFRDAANSRIKSIVLGMHEALPDSFSAGHSMNESPQKTASGRDAYRSLLAFHKATGKRVYVLASHSHFYMENIFNTACRQLEPNSVLPGWIIGTAGAVRYRLPKHEGSGEAMTDVYGYLLATVNPQGEIQFKFHRFSEQDVPGDVLQRYGADFVHQCFAKNSSDSTPEEPAGPPDCPK